MPDTCRSCEAPIVWAGVKGGRLMPVDAEPHTDGNIRFTGESVVLESGRVVPGIVVEGALLLDAGELYHRSHFATCPDAPDWRNP